MIGIGGGDAGEVAEAAGGEFDHLRLGDLLDVGGGADDVEGDQMRDVAGDGEHDVVVLGRHGLDRRAERAPQRRDLLDRFLVAPLAWGQDAPAAVEQLGEARVWTGMLGAGDRMAGDEYCLASEARRERWRITAALTEPTSVTMAPCAEMRRHGLHRIGGGADRHGDEHELGVLHRLSRGVGNGIAEAELLGAVMHLRGGS